MEAKMEDVKQAEKKVETTEEKVSVAKNKTAGAKTNTNAGARKTASKSVAKSSTGTAKKTTNTSVKKTTGATKPVEKPVETPVETPNTAEEKTEPVTAQETEKVVAVETQENAVTVEETESVADKEEVEKTVAIEETESAVTVGMAENAVTEEEKKEVAFIADSKDEKPRGYASYIQLAARYSEDQAQNMLRKKIHQYNEVHPRFLSKVDEISAFATERLYVPVYCGKTGVRYSWRTKTNQVKSSHEATCVKEKRFSSVNKDLEVENFQMEGQPEVQEIKKSELIKGDTYNFKKVVQDFNEYVKATAPAKRANIEKCGEEYTLVYVPVMKATCTLDSEQYVGYVNMYNGACYSSYKVSDTVENAAEKTVTAAKLAKRTLLSNFAFVLALSLMTLFSALKLTDWKFGALTVGSVWSVCILAALSLPSVVFACGISTVKKEAQIQKALSANKLPSAAWPRFVSVLGVLCTLIAVLVFFFRVMV